MSQTNIPFTNRGDPIDPATQTASNRPVNARVNSRPQNLDLNLNLNSNSNKANRDSNVATNQASNNGSLHWLTVALIYVALFVLAMYVIILVAAELDRRFNELPFDPHFYYIKEPNYKYLGFYNTMVRLTSPISPYMPLETFPQHHLLESNWRIIADEAISVYNNNRLLKMSELYDGFKPIAEDTWKVFMLQWYSSPNAENCAKMPRTAQLLSQCSGVHAAMLSILDSNTYIPPHRGPSIGCLRYHLLLRKPRRGRAAITVSGITHHYNKEGQGVLLDDTYQHFVRHDRERAHNPLTDGTDPVDVNDPRIVLFLDVLRPLPGPMHHFNKWLNTKGQFTDFVKGVNDRVEKAQTIDSQEQS